MLKGKKRLLIAGSALIGIAVLLTLYVVLIGFGVINSRQQPLVIRAGTAEKAYDGTPLVCEEWTLVQGTLKDGHTIIPLFTGSQTSPGQSENRMTVHVVDDNGSDVTKEYHIEYLTGTLSVYNSCLTIETTNQTKFYDGLPLQVSENSWMLKSGSLMLGHALDIKLEADLTEVGTCDNTARVKVVDMAGNDVTSLYEISTTCGTLSVLARPLTVESASATKIYDGTPLVAEDVQLRSGSLVKGHELKCVVTGSQTELGRSDNLFTVSVVNEKGEDVTSYYQITTVTGRLHVVEVYSAEDAEELSPEANSGINGSGGANSDVNVLAIQTNVSGPAYLRLQSFGAYNTDSFGWDVSPVLTKAVCGFNPMYWIGSALLQSGESLSTMSITWQVTPRGLLVPYYTQSDFATGVDDSYIALGASNYTVDYISFDAMETLVGKISSLSLPVDFSAEEEDYRTFVQENFLDIPTEQLREVMVRHMKAAGIKPTSKTIIQDVASYIRSVAVYNLDAPVPDDGVDPIIYFLDESKEGVCRHYASAAVMMYRALGIPARYVVGYLASAEADSLTMVTGMQAHAWVEVYINGLGWLPVEVTGGSSIPNGGVGTGEAEKIQITVRPVNVRGLANGTTYTATHFRIFGDMGENHELTCVFGGSLSQPGTATSYIASYSIQNTVTGEDVTHLYAVTLEEGLIQVVDKSADLDKIVDPILLAIKPKDIKTAYTGLPITASEWEYVEGSDFLKENHDLICSFGGERTEVGEEISTILSYCVVDRNTGADVSELYEVMCHNGVIKVDPPDLTLIIKPVDVFGIANGTTWAPTAWEFVEGSDNLLEGHTLRCKLVGSLDTIGRTNSLISQFAITDADGNDARHLYTIVLQQGRIQVKGSIHVKPADVVAMYTGQAHTATEWTYVEGSTGELLSNHKLTCKFSGSLTDPIWPEGEFSNEQDYLDACKQETRIEAYRIVDRETYKDVTSLYELMTEPGYIYIPTTEITIKPANVETLYTGETFIPMEWEFAEDGQNLFEGHTLFCEFTGSMTVPKFPEGEFATEEEYFKACCERSAIVDGSVMIVDGNGFDVSCMYRVNLADGYIYVQGRTLIIKPVDREVEYTGETFVATAWEYVDGSDELLCTRLDESTWSIYHELYCEYEGELTNPKFPTENYATDEEYLKACREATRIKADTIQIVDTVTGRDMTAMYRVFLLDGYIFMPGWEISIKPVDREEVFTGEEFKPDAWTYCGESEKLIQGHAISHVEYEGSLKFPIYPDKPYDEFENDDEYFKACQQVTNIVEGSVQIIDSFGNDVTGMYRINLHPGYIAITEMQFDISPEDVQAQYDGETHTATQYVIQAVRKMDKELLNTLLERFDFNVILEGSRCNPGTTEIKVTGVQVLDESGYDITRGFRWSASTGELIVYKEKLSIHTGSAQMTYNGAAQRYEEWQMDDGELMAGHELRLLFPEITSVGKISNRPEVKIVDQDGIDVTNQYYIDLTAGELEIQPIALEIRSDDATRPYEPGVPLTCGTYTVTGTLASGETMEIKVAITGTQTKPGKSQNFIRLEEVRIDRDGVDTTKNYKINAVAGWLTVTPPIV